MDRTRSDIELHTAGATVRHESPFANVVAIAVDDTAVYWLVNGNGSPGGVMKLPLALDAAGH